ncbi:MAG: aromatic hydrocarbon degradation protein [Gammaproteobacteria bacterium]|nr:aromatic hydrocarbon degradation protein [Gammaproteobacteria bacterium]
MKRSLLFIAMAVAAPQLMAGGWKVPEQSLKSTALSAAYIANAHGADASYFNPAAMAFNEDRNMIDASATYIGLSGIDHIRSGATVDSSEKEQFFMPTFHYSSGDINNWRFGLSMVAPNGLAKQWKGTNAAVANKFALKVIEINPTTAYKFNDQFAIGGGLRAVYSEGTVRSSDSANPLIPIGRDMEGDSWDFGFNLAAIYKPVEQLSLAATYRSEVSLTEEGEATLTNTHPLVPPHLRPFTVFRDDASVTIPAPAALNLAAAYTFANTTTVEFVYERTFWSAYEELDFNYARDPSLTFAGYALFDTPAPKNWDDTNTYRIGVTHDLNPKWTLMAGFAIDETPAPDETVGIELPDSDAKIYSFGAQYHYSNDISLGAAILYDQKESRTIDASNTSTGVAPGDEFKNASATLVTVGLEYRF